MSTSTSVRSRLATGDWTLARRNLDWKAVGTIVSLVASLGSVVVSVFAVGLQGAQNAEQHYITPGFVVTEDCKIRMASLPEGSHLVSFRLQAGPSEAWGSEQVNQLDDSLDVSSLVNRALRPLRSGFIDTSSSSHHSHRRRGDYDTYDYDDIWPTDEYFAPLLAEYAVEFHGLQTDYLAILSLRIDVDQASYSAIDGQLVRPMLPRCRALTYETQGYAERHSAELSSASEWRDFMREVFETEHERQRAWASYFRDRFRHRGGWVDL
jgi:hypothetical protein